MPSIQPNRYEHANYCSSQCPLQKFVLITIPLPKISILLHCAVYPLQNQHPYNRIFEVKIRLCYRLCLVAHPSTYHSVVNLSDKSNDKKLTCTKHMQFLVHITCVDTCRVAHQQKSTYRSHHQHYFRMVFLQIYTLLHCYRPQNKVVSEPT